MELAVKAAFMVLGAISEIIKPLAPRWYAAHREALFLTTGMAFNLVAAGVASGWFSYPRTFTAILRWWMDPIFYGVVFASVEQVRIDWTTQGAAFSTLACHQVCTA
jgi:hypothetical protein